MAKTDEQSLPSIVSALKALSSRAKALRAKVDTINGQINALSDAPVSLDDFATYLRKWVDRRAAQYGSGLNAAALVTESRHASDGNEPLNSKSWSELEGYAKAHGNVFSIFHRSAVIFNQRESLLIDAFCFFMPDVVFQKLFDQIKKDCGGRWGNDDATPIAQRIKSIKAFNAELATLQPEVKKVEAEIGSVSSAIADAAQ